MALAVLTFFIRVSNGRLENRVYEYDARVRMLFFSSFIKLYEFLFDTYGVDGYTN